MSERLLLQFTVAGKLHEVYGGHPEAAWNLAGEWIADIPHLDAESLERLFARTAMFSRDARLRLEGLAASLATDDQQLYPWG